MKQLAVVGGATRYEFRMQVRRRSVWVVLLLLGLIIFLLWSLLAGPALSGHYAAVGGDKKLLPGVPRVWVPPSYSDAVLGWAQLLAMFLPLGVGLVLADRLARDRSTLVDELFDAAPGALGARLFGKYLGSVFATLVPVVVLYVAGVLYMLWRLPDVAMLPLASAAFAAILLPGTLFVAGFSIAIPVVVRVPIYQFLFIGYWFWANLMSPKIGIPSIVGTLLNAAGPWAQEGIFNFDWTFLQLHATPLQGYLSIALLVGLGMVGLAAGWGYLRWLQARR
jgi:ABC-2 type transport system permease protein